MDKKKKFTSAMGDLKGILDKEGIDLNSSDNLNIDNSDDLFLDPESITDEIISEFEQNLKKTRSNKPEQPISPELDIDTTPVDLPTLDGTISIVDETISDSSELNDYISDMDDDTFDLMEFSSSEDLEEKVSSITEPQHLVDFAEQESNNVYIQKLKADLQRKLALQVEKSIDELRVKLLASIRNEIDQLFKK